MQQYSPLFNAIVKKNLSGLATADFLKQLTKKYPYFIPTQFYLLQQTQQDDEAYHQQAAKAAALFNNPHWLHFQLQQTTLASTAIKEITPTKILSEENSDNNDDAVAATIQTPSPEQINITLNAGDNTATETPMLTPEELMLSENTGNNDDEAIIMEDEIAPIKINISIPETNIKDDALTFEPMHLVDYFASQGIKLSEEVQPADKLGKQLKSFTEWLKTMKKIHVPDTGLSAGHADIAIQTLAEKSNTEGEVVTEAMADVLLQQGKAAKAVELYKKLSLLNPSKIAYFAAKIEQLKG